MLGTATFVPAPVLSMVLKHLVRVAARMKTVPLDCHAPVELAKRIMVRVAHREASVFLICVLTQFAVLPALLLGTLGKPVLMGAMLTTRGVVVVYANSAGILMMMEAKNVHPHV
jgi:hypothetical protein